MAVERESVDHERVAQQVEELAPVAHRVGATEPEVSSRLRLMVSASLRHT